MGLTMTNLRCLLLAPDGERCEFRTDDSFILSQHQHRHAEFDQWAHAPHRWWDNCPHCGAPIRLTSKLVLRAHGHPSQRCPGGGSRGIFQRRCVGLPGRLGVQADG